MPFNANILDPTIPLRAVQGGGAAAVALKTPAEFAEERDRARNTKAVADFNTQRASDAQREAQRQTLLEQIATETAGDWEEMERRLAAVDPELGLKVRKGRFDAQRSMHEAFVSRMEEERAGADIMSSFVRMVQQAPDLYPQLRAAIEARLPEDVRGVLPAEYDPRVLAALEEAAIPAKEAMARAQQNHELILKGDWQKGLFGQLADADDEEEWNNIVESYKPFLPAGSLAMVPAWTPDAPDKIARIVMGPDAVIDNDRADQRDAVLERQGDARVAIASRRAAQAASGGSGGGSAAVSGSMVEAVMANPTLFQQLTPTERTKLIPALQARGFKFDAAEAAAGTTKVAATIAEKVAGVEQSLSVLDKMEANVPTDMLGPIAGRWTKFSAGMPGVPVPQPVAKYLAEEGTLRNAVIKATTGAAMSEPEAKRIMEQIPAITDKPEVWRAKAQATRENLTILRQRMLELSGASGDMPASTPGASTQRRAIKGGGVAELRGGKWIRVE